MFTGNKKASTMLILEVLREYTDENHYLTQQQICDKLYDIYDLEMERKSVGSALTLLEDLGYDINKGQNGGWALLSRTFEISEIAFLIDAIFSSKSIPGDRAVELSEKVSSCLSKYQRKSYDYLYKSTEVSRTSNSEVLLNIEIIDDAIKRNKWIGFKYMTFDDDGNMIGSYNEAIRKYSPCYLVNNFGRYYLIAYRATKNQIEIFRIDYMKDVIVIEDRVRVDPNTISDFQSYSSFTDYINEHIYLYNGTTINAVLEIDHPSTLRYIYDWFGESAKFYKEGDRRLVKVKCNENALRIWALQYGKHVKVVSPQTLVDSVKAAAQDIVDMYNSIENIS